MNENRDRQAMWPAEDRLWRHPSERAKHPTYSEQSMYSQQLRRARRQIMITGGTLVGASLAASLFLLQTMDDPQPPQQAGFRSAIVASTVSIDSTSVVSTTAPSIVLAGLNH